MATTPEHDAKIATMTFAAVYPHYAAKVEKKGRTVDELHEVIAWLTGFTTSELQSFIKSGATLADFFDRSTINPNASLVTGSICGYRIEEIRTPLTRHVRVLDKLIDELARGREIDAILRRR